MQLKPKKQRAGMVLHLEDEEGTSKCDLQDSKSYPLLVVPCAFTRRIDAQSGRFSYSGAVAETELHEMNVDLPWNTIRYYRIPKKDKERIKSELDDCQINERILFPDLDGCARYLSDGNL